MALSELRHPIDSFRLRRETRREESQRQQDAYSQKLESLQERAAQLTAQMRPMVAFSGSVTEYSVFTGIPHEIVDTKRPDKFISGSDVREASVRGEYTGKPLYITTRDSIFYAAVELGATAVVEFRFNREGMADQFGRRLICSGTPVREVAPALPQS